MTATTLVSNVKAEPRYAVYRLRPVRTRSRASGRRPPPVAPRRGAPCSEARSLAPRRRRCRFRPYAPLGAPREARVMCAFDAWSSNPPDHGCTHLHPSGCQPEKQQHDRQDDQQFDRPDGLHGAYRAAFPSICIASVSLATSGVRKALTPFHLPVPWPMPMRWRRCP
jgi:hypothetical protein